MKKTTVILLLIALILLLSCCSVNAYNYADSRRYTAGAATVTGRVEKLDVSWIDGGENIGYHSGEGVRLSEECGWYLDEENELHWWLDGDTLYVKYAESGLRLSRSLNKELTVLLPEGLALDQLTINAVSANVETEDVVADVVTINTVSGDARMDVARAKRLTANAVSGNVTLQFDRAPEKAETSTVSGNVTIALPEGAAFHADVDTVSGTVGGDLPLEKLGRGEYASGNGGCTIDVETVSGNVYLNEAK